MYVYIYVSGLDYRSNPQVFYTYLYNHGAYRLLNFSRRFQKRNGRYVTVSEAKRLRIYNGHM
jgi:hypothetical protein